MVSAILLMIRGATCDQKTNHNVLEYTKHTTQLNTASEDIPKQKKQGVKNGGNEIFTHIGEFIWKKIQVPDENWGLFVPNVSFQCCNYHAATGNFIPNLNF